MMADHSISPKIKKEEKVNGQVWIKDKKIYVKNEKGLGLPPAIAPCQGIKLIINGEECNHLIVPREEDIIEIVTETITSDELIEIMISSDEMEATLHAKPARTINLEVMNAEPSNRIDIKVLEIAENISFISEEKVYDLLVKKVIGIGILEDNIKEACSTNEERIIVIAKGIPIIPPKDAWIEYLFSQEKFEIDLSEDEFGRVDFRNFVDYKSSIAGDVLAIKHLMEQGVNGTTITGKEIKVPLPKDVALCSGNGVIIEEAGRIARCIKSGKVERQSYPGKTVIIVNEKLEINTDVDIKIGNVKFKGNVIINKNVKEAMEVAAKGDVFIKGDCHFATVTSGNNLAIKGNVISSKLEAGNRNIIIRSPSEDIKPIVDSIDSIILEIEQSCEGKPISIVYPQGIGSKVREILNTRCQKLSQDIYNFIIALKSNQYDCLIEKSDEILSAAKVFLGSCAPIKSINHLYKIKAIMTGLTYYANSDDIIAEGNAVLTYAANSDIKARGSIKIGNKGCFNCNITAKEKVSIGGIVRGCEIHSDKTVEINQVGSEMGVETVISVPDKGTIKIKKIFNDNIIKVGPFTYRFIEAETNVFARIIEGKLLIR